MSHHSIIAGLCFVGFIVTILVAMFRSVADTDKRAIKPPEWFKCMACGGYECEDGRQSFRSPLTFPKGKIARYRVRECTDCRGKAVAIYDFNGGHKISSPRNPPALNSESTKQVAGSKEFQRI